MNLFDILGNDVRVRVLIILAERGSSTFTELNDACKISAGTLAYHLDVTSELISKTGDKYHLSTIGLYAYELVMQVKDYLQRNGQIKAT